MPVLLKPLQKLIGNASTTKDSMKSGGTFTTTNFLACGLSHDTAGYLCCCLGLPQQIHVNLFCVRVTCDAIKAKIRERRVTCQAIKA